MPYEQMRCLVGTPNLENAFFVITVQNIEITDAVQRIRTSDRIAPPCLIERRSVDAFLIFLMISSVFSAENSNYSVTSELYTSFVCKYHGILGAFFCSFVWTIFSKICRVVFDRDLLGRNSAKNTMFLHYSSHNCS